MTDKVVNYTDEQTVAVVDAYEAAENAVARKAVVAEYAEDFGKKPASVIAKLVSEGVYVAAKAAKVARPKKSELVDVISRRVANDEVDFDSLEKATWVVLVALVEALAPVEDEVAA
jgi:hypothetical protein